MRERSPCVYIMASGHYGTLYTGATSDIVTRVIQHREVRENPHWDDLAVSLLGLPPLR